MITENQKQNNLKDAFSSGQIGSKLWLCEQLESLFKNIDSIWIYGGWYATTAFLLKSRSNIDISTIRSYDVDPECESVADMINENWVYQGWQFKAHTADCSTLNPVLGKPELIINTSTEHFDSMEWWHNIPKGTYVAIQGNNMKHDDHVVYSKSLDDFCHAYPTDTILYKGELEFIYPNWKFTRFMLIGIK
jgi:hypothetical protein